MDLNDFPAIFFGGPLAGRENTRNRDSATIAFARFKGFGYIPLTSPDGSASAGEITNRKGNLVTIWYGYPGTEHLMAVHCVICKSDTHMYPSHMLRGSSHQGCALKGAAKRKAFVNDLMGAPVTMPPRQDQPNGSTSKAKEVPAATEATEAEETASEARTEAVTDAAESRPVPEPVTQPPKSQKVRKAPKPAPPRRSAPSTNVLRALLSFDD